MIRIPKWPKVNKGVCVSHRDLAQPSQSHGERRGHEVLKCEVEALLVKAQSAVQRFLHCAPHQVSHVPCRALAQLLI